VKDNNLYNSIGTISHIGISPSLSCDNLIRTVAAEKVLKNVLGKVLENHFKKRVGTLNEELPISSSIIPY